MGPSGKMKTLCQQSKSNDQVINVDELRLSASNKRNYKENGQIQLRRGRVRSWVLVCFHHVNTLHHNVSVQQNLNERVISSRKAAQMEIIVHFKRSLISPNLQKICYLYFVAHITFILFHNRRKCDIRHNNSLFQVSFYMKFAIQTELNWIFFTFVIVTDVFFLL